MKFSARPPKSSMPIKSLPVKGIPVGPIGPVRDLPLTSGPNVKMPSPASSSSSSSSSSIPKRPISSPAVPAFRTTRSVIAKKTKSNRASNKTSSFFNRSKHRNW